MASDSWSIACPTTVSTAVQEAFWDVATIFILNFMWFKTQLVVSPKWTQCIPYIFTCNLHQSVFSCRMLQIMCWHICIKLWFITARLMMASTNQLTQWCKIFLWKFMVAQPTGTHMFNFIFNQLNPAHALTCSYSMIHFDVIVWFMCRYSILLWCFLIKIRHVSTFLIFSMHSKCPANCILLDLITLIIFVKSPNYQLPFHVTTSFSLLLLIFKVQIFSPELGFQITTNLNSHLS